MGSTNLWLIHPLDVRILRDPNRINRILRAVIRKDYIEPDQNFPDAVDACSLDGCLKLPRKS